MHLPLRAQSFYHDGMSEWYYVKNGSENGPVTFEKLQELASGGLLDAISELVWTSTMKDWTPASQVPGLFTTSVSAAPSPPSLPRRRLAAAAQGLSAANQSDPYATPPSTWAPPVAHAPTSSTLSGAEIVHGSEPIKVLACVNRGFELTKRHASTIIIVGLIYIGVSLAFNKVGQLVYSDMTKAMSQAEGPHEMFEAFVRYGFVLSPVGLLFEVVSRVVLTFLSLGATRIGLNLVTGKKTSVAMLFGEGNKLLRALGATILFGLMVGLGILLLIVPGVYLWLRYGQYLTAIVDRDMGVFEAFSYSSSITTNNRSNLFVLSLFALLLCIAGALACGVGMLITMPVAWLSYKVSYRWMQYGHSAAMDKPSTKTPMLAGI